MRSINIANFLFFLSFFLFFFVYGYIVGMYKIFPYAILDHAKDSVVQVYEESRTLTGIKPEHFLQPARYDGEGVTVNDAPEDRKELILLSGFFGETNELRLIRRDGSIVARWPVRFSEIFPDASHLRRPPATDWNIDTHGALILPDGSVVFNFERGGSVKLDRCGDVIWTLSHETHHSVELAADGGYWAPGRRYLSRETESPFPPFETPIKEDTILKISEDGQVLAEISVPQIFYDNHLEALLTSSGHSFETGMAWDSEIVHLNKIDELTSDIADDFPLFEAGDLALSIRALNIIMVVDPGTGAVKWWRIGPWVRQHDPEFRSGGTIVVFNNNAYRTAFGAGSDKSDISIPRVSNIVEIDPVSDDYQIIYGSKKGQEMLSVIRGKLELTPRGGLLVTEFEGGRVFETNAAGDLIWEYINRFSSEEVAEITEARLYPESYFAVSDWSCEGRGNN
jgi:hypothetical protein